MPGNARSYLKPGALDRILGRALVLLVWIGLIRGHFYVLEVRGRKTGRTISLPVDPLDFEGRRYPVCARGNANWVRNARAAGEVALVRAMRRRRYARASFPPACVHRFSKPISTASLARSSASFPYRRDRRWNHSTIWRRVTRSSSCSHWTRLHRAPGRPYDENESLVAGVAANRQGRRPMSRRQKPAGQSMRSTAA